MQFGIWYCDMKEIKSNGTFCLCFPNTEPREEETNMTVASMMTWLAWYDVTWKPFIHVVISSCYNSEFHARNIRRSSGSCLMIAVYYVRETLRTAWWSPYIMCVKLRVVTWWNNNVFSVYYFIIRSALRHGALFTVIIGTFDVVIYIYIYINTLSLTCVQFRLGLECHLT